MLILLFHLPGSQEDVILSYEPVLRQESKFSLSASQFSTRLYDLQVYNLLAL